MSANQVIGSNRLIDKLQRMPIEITKDVKKEIALSAFEIEKEAKLSIQKRQSVGILYPSRRGKNIKHQASAPGFPPNTDIGDLVKSIHTAFPISGKGLIAEVGSDLDYATYLEKGAMPRLAPRPWLFPAFEATKQKNVTRIRKSVNKALKKFREVKNIMRSFGL